MKRPLSNFLLGLTFMAAGAEYVAQEMIAPCDTYNAMEEYFRQDPMARQVYESAQKAVHQHPQTIAGKSATTEYTIPVVFHILHMGGSENIPDASCIAALDWVNKDLARAHGDASTVAQPFQSFYIPSNIKLMLAKRDNNGNCINGIVHTYDTRTVWDRTTNFASLYAGILNSFPRNKYLNIIVVKEIVAQANQTGIVVGYTFKPGSITPAYDAIVYRADYMDGTTKARNLTHELGHWLGLDHTFGATNNPGVSCGDDNLKGVYNVVDDTPPTMGNFGKCPSSASGNVCATTGTNGYSAGQHNVENIMDYSTCPKNLTAGQTAAMHKVLDGAAVPNSTRNNLWQQANLVFTAVNSVGNCAPIADFLSTTQTYTVCAGGSLTFRDYSYNAVITSYNWSVDNSGIVSSPSASLTNIMFPFEGTYQVVLNVANANGSSAITRTVLALNSVPGLTGPFSESFELFDIPAGWKVGNEGNLGSTFEPTNEAIAYDGMISLMLNNSGNGPNQTDYLELPILDMSTSPNKKFEFAYAYARKSSGHNDNFRVLASTDCGSTWTELLSLSAAQMQANSGGVTSTPFYPQAIEQWKVIELSTFQLSAAKWALVQNSPHLILRFSFTQVTGFGNNFFLDAINMPEGPGDPTAISHHVLKNNLALYPNPSDGVTSVSFSLRDQATIKLTVTDILGKTVYSQPAVLMSSGDHELSINTADELPKGVYSVNLNVGGTNVSKKLIVK